MAVPPSVNEVMDDILCELRRKGIHVSDRKYFGFTPIVQAQAWLEGRRAVIVEDLMVLDAYLWTSPEELPQIKKLLVDICENPLGERIDSLRAMADEAYESFEQERQTAGPRALTAFRNNLLTVYRQYSALADDAGTGTDKARVEQLYSYMEELNQKSCASVNFTYLSLPELEQVMVQRNTNTI